MKCEGDRCNTGKDLVKNPNLGKEGVAVSWRRHWLKGKDFVFSFLSTFRVGGKEKVKYKAVLG